MGVMEEEEEVVVVVVVVQEVVAMISVGFTSIKASDWSITPDWSETNLLKFLVPVYMMLQILDRPSASSRPFLSRTSTAWFPKLLYQADWLRLR
ncbi:hypothetical protein EYF80_033968 [Liparis tanakae]|uniref:Uncharacterized protein n=1 Tax=Liparis tanakae TaxID=230148 RepID=A0A4Z2GQQ4_9TELE|nr:hypothetical protein EYF80_033968 [Liparis tanakae]